MAGWAALRAPVQGALATRRATRSDAGSCLADRRRPPPAPRPRAFSRRRYTCTLARQVGKNGTIPSYCTALCRDAASCAFPQALHDTNVPSFSLPNLTPGARRRVNASRVVTYVGDAGATFTPVIEAPAGFAITVTVLNTTTAPGAVYNARNLTFARANQTRTYVLDIAIPATRPAAGVKVPSQPGLWYFASLTWRDTLNRFSARSTIAIELR